MPSAAGMSLADVTAIVPVATQPLAQAVTDAKNAAQNAQTAASAAQTTASTAKTTADAAQSTITTTLAPGYSSLTEIAATVQSLNAASVADRQQLNTRTAALEARAASLEARKWLVQKVPVTTSAALALGATVDLTVTWPTAMPDTNYIIDILPDASGVLVSSMVALKSHSTTGAVVTVKALVALAVGYKIMVQAGRWG